ncbi:glycosyltransferase [uncultured Draconibacterium sp.]|uniref:glycosyltransferase n=1 Tax=uncultured Draconibacterium sp. TaxID=1573823 RepID=UPI0025D875E0|nr:glycosyltransferase [uncultured Draconibacterium sp.]
MNNIKSGDSMIIVIDNTPDLINEELQSYSRVHKNILYSPLRENRGIAEAQNIGIKKAKRIEGITHILFLDQDSRIRKDFPLKMIEEYDKVINQVPKLAAIGPTPINIVSNTPYKQEKNTPDNKELDYHFASKLISSGMLISLKTIEDVGMMDSSLFIDTVDFEWCWRANAKGYKCCMTNRVEMLHKVGEKDYSLFGYKILLSSPSRYYYQYRNLIILLKRNYVPINWKFKNILKKIFFLVYIPLVAPNSKKIISNMIQGIKDGFIYSTH